MTALQGWLLQPLQPPAARPSHSGALQCARALYHLEHDHVESGLQVVLRAKGRQKGGVFGLATVAAELVIGHSTRRDDVCEQTAQRVCVDACAANCKSRRHARDGRVCERCSGDEQRFCKIRTYGAGRAVGIECNLPFTAARAAHMTADSSSAADMQARSSDCCQCARASAAHVGTCMTRL
jgi:hypothetical protein